MNNIILLAPPAAGKGTIVKLLCEKYNYVSISTGDILREKAKNDSDLSELLKSGKLVPDDVVFNFLESKLNKLDNISYILDGFPRTKKQAIMYDEFLKSTNRSLGVVIYLDIDKDELIKRVTTRVICPNCKKIYSLRDEKFAPKEYMICDDCSSHLKYREDDKEDIFEKRYDEYLKNTLPLINYYKDKGVCILISDYDAKAIVSRISSLVNYND